MPDKPLINGDIDDKYQALSSNAAAARVIAGTIEGTIGPKGLDIMMVDRFGDVVISNDGVTILKSMEVNHPAARMMIHAARAQQEEVGDGTTTATILAGALINEGVNQILKGVPVTQVLQGMQLGINRAMELMRQHAIEVFSVDDPLLFQAALIAGRGQEDLAHLVLEAGHMVGLNSLIDKDCHLARAIQAREGTGSRAFRGIMVSRLPLNREMPFSLKDARVLLLDDALAPEEVDREARGTDSGFQYYLQNKESYLNNLVKICNMDVNLVMTDRGIDDLAEQVFTEAGIICIPRVSPVEMEQAARHTGARKIKRSVLNRDPDVIEANLGYVGCVEVDQRLKATFLYEGKAEALATVVVGASTEELVEERERIARDAAAAFQAALRGGIVPGGGALEVWIAGQLEELAREVKGMASYGVLCVKEALLRPFICIAANAGFNPLEKLADLQAEQQLYHQSALGLDCDSGEIINMAKAGIVDPYLVKVHALRTAGEVAMAILRIHSIIKMKDGDAGDQ